MATIAPSAPAANGATRRLDRAFVREGGRIGLSSVGCTQMRSIRSRRRAARPVVLGPQRIVIDTVAIVRWPSRSSSPPGPIAASLTTGPAIATAPGGPHRAPNRRARRLPRLWRVPVPPTESDSHDWIALTTEPLPSDVALGWASTPAAGAVVSFLGIVRDHAEGRDGVEAMTYEAYEDPARRAMTEVVARRPRPLARPRTRRAPAPRRRSRGCPNRRSLVVVSAPHRAAAFEAARFCIDTLKETVPIWKQEHWSGGSDWAVEQHPIRRVEPARRIEAV